MSETHASAHRAQPASTRSAAHSHGSHDTAGMSHGQAQVHNLQRIIGNQAIQRMVDVQREEDEAKEAQGEDPSATSAVPDEAKGPPSA